MTNLGSIIVLLQLVLTLLSNPQTAQNPQIQALATQAINSATLALSQPVDTPVAPSAPSTNVVPQPIYVAPVTPPSISSSPQANILPVWTAVIHGLTDGDKMFTGERNTNPYIQLYDAQGRMINDQTVIITTDNAIPSGVDWGVGVTETNHPELFLTDFLYLGSNIKNGNNYLGYNFEYTPMTDGTHTITVATEGSAKNVQIQSIPR